MNIFRLTNIKLTILLAILLAVGSLWVIPGPDRVGAMAWVEFEAQVQQGQERQAKLRVDSNVPVNALDVTVRYPKDILEAEGVGREDSEFETVVFEPSYDTKWGTARFAQVSLDPVEGENLLVGTIDFKALKPGYPQFDIEGKIVQHDGKGTDVLVEAHDRSVGQWMVDELTRIIPW